MDDNTIRAAAVAAAVAMLLAKSAVAQVHPERPTWDHEKCYGVAKAGMNDCFTPSNSCGGTSARDGERGAWLYVPKGTCERLVGGSLNAG
jgi:uncharacterized membrane protein